MARLAREPLVHFLLAGAALFALYGLLSGAGTPRGDRIVVGADEVARLATTFERTWLRPPTATELDRLVQDFVDEEVLYREALALGLDRDDLVVRRRLRQKMEFLHLDLVEPAAATDAELAAYLEEHAERFREPARLDFRQLFFRPEPDAAAARARAESVLAQLRAGASGQHGDATLLPEHTRDASERDVAGTFGPGFAAELLALRGEGWQGPLASSFGLHLVRVERHTPERLPPLEEIRERVERELQLERRARAERSFLDRLRSRYEIEIEAPEPAVAATGP